jgi:hypothetical protein
MANETKGHPSAADAHLLSAAEALRMWLGELRGDSLGGNRVAAMMIALAAEGYINAALMTLLGRSDFEGVDRLSTPEKYFIGLGYAHRGLELQRSTDEAAALVNLFRTRNDLTHSKAPEERSLFPPRAEIGEWIGVVALIVSRWHDASGGVIPETFSAYTRHFARRLPALKGEDGVNQLEALSGAIDACSPFDLMMKPRNAPLGALSIMRTSFPATPPDPLWIEELGDPDDARAPRKRLRD